MTQTIRIIGRSTKSDEQHLDLVCKVAIATVPPSRRDPDGGLVGYPTAITLYGMEDDSLAKLRDRQWKSTHIPWVVELDAEAQDLPIGQVFVDGTDVKLTV